MTTTPQSQGLKLHHEQPDRRKLLLKAICANKAYAVLWQPNISVRINIRTKSHGFISTLSNSHYLARLHNGLPHIDDDLYEALRKAVGDA